MTCLLRFFSPVLVSGIFFISATVTTATATDLTPDPYSPNLYLRLGLPNRSPLESVKKAYRKLIGKYHEDVYHGRDAHEISVNLNEANSILSNPEKKSQYDALLGQKPPRSFQSEAKPGSSPPDFGKFENDYRELNELKAKHPEYGAYFDGVIAWYIVPRLPNPPGFWSADMPHVWPTDERLISISLESGNGFLLQNLAFDILTLPGWEGRIDILWAILEKDRHEANSCIGEFVHRHAWVNEQGAQVLNLLIDRGYFIQVARSLALGDMGDWIDDRWVEGKGWYSRQDGVDLMRKLIARADDKGLDYLERGIFNISKSRSDLNWVKAFRKLDEVRDLEYVSARILRAIYDQNPHLVKEPTPPCEYRHLRKKRLMLGSGKKQRS